nr:syntaxin-10 isoform X1 [Vicugna pacos]
MSLEDPFFVVRGEVQKAVNTARGLYQRWCELLQEGAAVGREELDWTTNELRNGLRSIEWDLEDLEETIGIVEANPSKFKLPAGDLQERKVFVERMREEVQEMKDHMVSPAAIAFMERNNRETLTSKPATLKSSSDLLDASVVSATSRYIEEQQATQQLIMDQQDHQLEMVSGSIQVLKHMSGRVREELDEQGIMLDAFAHEMDHTQSRMDGVLRKMAKVSHMPVTADSGVPLWCCWGCFSWSSSCSSLSDPGPPQGAGALSWGSQQGPAPWEEGGHAWGAVPRFLFRASRTLRALGWSPHHWSCLKCT